MLRHSLRTAAVLLLLMAAGCTSPVAPRSTVYGPIEPDIPRRIYVTTNGEREAILTYLELAGFSIESDPRNATFVLAVQLGSKRDTRDCGAVRNVTYALSHSGVLIARIVGRGRFGRCSPNILSQMSQELARLFSR